eukprot:TRINITY_DN20049_c0_g1_i1.p1 TRINITY_DN20049_c0_g1~~TRINITY_DN20049_c0_g1_i1.p1  ORF type:complete len:471 (+),score=72.19 TRINITY_DN20049_c0_g1_i1:222-1634(+)
MIKLLQISKNFFSPLQNRIPSLNSINIIQESLQSNNLSNVIYQQFSKKKVIKKKTVKKSDGSSKEKKTSIVLNDNQVTQKLQQQTALSEKLRQQRAKILPQEIRDIPIKTQLKCFEQKRSTDELIKMYEKQIQNIYGRKVIIDQKQIDFFKTRVYSDPKPLDFFPNPNQLQKARKNGLAIKTKQVYYDCSSQVNEKFKDQIKQVIPTDYDHKTRRCGVLATKIGSTQLWDKWGTLQRLTVLQLDRCQVVQVKTFEKEGLYAIQVGCGQKNLKALKKPQIGHFVKADIPPKVKLCEFPVTTENLLPTGYMFSVRHFTPGQFIDVISYSKGHGFQGAMWRWNFHGMPASHGCSLKHRHLGATGQRQNASKVFKNKKMAGRMGNERRTIRNLQVYKIDVDRQLIYVKGSIPGKASKTCQIRDATFKWYENKNYLNFPTFVPEPGKEYAKQVTMLPPMKDPQENYYHDNDSIDF